MATALKVGALAKRTGVTVRTLHHYDEIGLLTPSSRTASGHRLYSEEDVARLQQIASLRHLGLALEEIRACLARPEYTLERTLDLQIERIDERIEEQRRLRALVQRLRERVRSAAGASVEELARTIEGTMSYERHFTPEQLSRLRARREDVGDERIRDVEREWVEVFAAFQEAMDAGLDPAGDEVAGLARRSASLVEEFTGGDPDIAASLGEMYRTEGGPKVMSDHGLDVSTDLWDYMARARRALMGEG